MFQNAFLNTSTRLLAKLISKQKRNKKSKAKQVNKFSIILFKNKRRN